MTLIVCRIQPALRGQASFLMEKFRPLRDHLGDRGPNSLRRRPSPFDYIACYMTGELSYENPRRKDLAKPGITDDDR
ncbi:hypothetical protein N619_04120 [Ectopseudomonas oleovorans]|nr:hypothetical protein N619_04120 [Pseudomonas oleovorans]